MAVTVTLELSPAAEARLRERAAWCGQSVINYLLTLSELEDYADLLLTAEELDIIREQIANHLADDTRVPMKEFRAEMMAKIERLKKRQGAVA